MDLIASTNLFAERVYEISFFMGILITVLFYFEYKKMEETFDPHSHLSIKMQKRGLKT